VLKLSTLVGNRGLWPASGYSLMMHIHKVSVGSECECEYEYVNLYSAQLEKTSRALAAK